MTINNKSTKLTLVMWLAWTLMAALLPTTSYAEYETPKTFLATQTCKVHGPMPR